MTTRIDLLARAAIVAAVLLSARAAFAQTDAAVTTPPPNIVVPNYAGVPVGPYGGLEGGAYVARATDPSAAWFNPAGLSRSTGAEISGSAGIYQLTTVSPSAFPDSGGSVQQVPSLVGFTFKAGRLTIGTAVLTTVSWNQQTDSQIIVSSNSGGNPERFAYSAQSSLNRRVIALSAGYDNQKKWRLGAGLAFSYTSVELSQTASDRIADPTQLRTLLVSSHGNGSTLQLRPIIGADVQASPHIRIGGVLRTSGFSIFKNGGATLDGTANAGAAAVGASFFDPSASFESKLPFEYVGGVALTGARAEFEIDVMGYSSIAPYAMLSSAQPVAVYRDTGNGSAPSVTTQPFPGLTSASRAIANVTAGGHVQLFASRSVRLHYGVGSDLSPVAPEDKAFDRVNLFVWTLGLSGQAGKLSYSAGVNYRAGTSDAVTVRNLLNGRTVDQTIDIRTIGMIYSLAYQF